MTVYALRLQNGTDTAARVRMADLLGLMPNGNLGARGGIRPGPTAGNVAVVAGTMKVSVQPFLAFIDGGVSDTQGGYPFVSDAVVELTLANGHASLSRTDVVCAVVRDDPFDSSGSLAAAIEVVQGSPGGGVPGLPANSLPLRNVVVPAGASTGTGGLSSGALSTDRRTYISGLGGVVPVASATERNTLTVNDGQLVYLNDTDHLQLRRNGAWHELTNPPHVRALGLGAATKDATLAFTEVEDTHSAYSAGAFTAPVAGVYNISASVGWTFAPGGAGAVMRVHKGGVAQFTSHEFATGTNWQGMDMTHELRLTAGEVITVQSGATTFTPNGPACFLAINYVRP